MDCDVGTAGAQSDAIEDRFLGVFRPDALNPSCPPVWLEEAVPLFGIGVILNLPSAPLMYMPCPVTGSSPTVACLRSSMKVHNPILRSWAIPLTPTVCDVDWGAQD